MAYITGTRRVGRSQAATIFWGLVSVFFATAACYFYGKYHDNQVTADQLRDQVLTLQEQRETLSSEKDKLQASISETETELKTREDFLQDKEANLALEESRLDSAGQNNDSQTERNRSQAAAVKLFNDTVQKFVKNDTDVELRGGRPVLRVPSSVFFDFGGTTLKPEGKALLLKIIQALSGQMDRFELRLETFTDSDGENGPDETTPSPTNPEPTGDVPKALKKPVMTSWELTGARAAALEHFLRDQSGSVPFQNIIVVPRADFQPIIPGSEPHARNRRVEITIAPLPLPFRQPDLLHAPETKEGKAKTAAKSEGKSPAAKAVTSAKNTDAESIVLPIKGRRINNDMAESKEIPPPDEGAVPLDYPTPGQRQLLWTALTALALTLLVGVAGLVFLGFISFLSWAYPVLLPIGLAVIIALVLEPVVNFLQKRGIKRRTGTLGTCLMAVVVFLLFWVFLLPSLAGEAGKFLQSLPGLINEGVDKLENLGAAADEEPVIVPATNSAPTNLVVAPPLAFTSQTGTNIAAAPVVVPPPPVRTLHNRHAPLPRRIIAHSEMQDWIKTNLPLAEATIQNAVAHLVYTAVGPVGQALGFLLGFGFVPIYVYYFLADQEDISGHWHEYVPLRRSPLRDEVVSVVAEINAVLVKYFRGQIVVAACNGLLTSIGLIAIGIPYGLILGIITGALSIVPFLGIIISILPALLLGFLDSGGWLKPALVLVVFAVVQFCESMFITPRVQSHSTGLHPLTIIVGILFWSMLLPGLLGPVVAVPLTCSVVVLMRRYVWQIRR